MMVVMENNSTRQTDSPGCRLPVTGYTVLYSLLDEDLRLIYRAITKVSFANVGYNGL